MHARAGTPALPEDLIDVDALIGAYYDRVPDPDDGRGRIVRFTRKGVRALDESNAVKQAIDAEWRAGLGDARYDALVEALDALNEQTA